MLPSGGAQIFCQRAKCAPPPAYTNALVRRWGQRSHVPRRKD